MTPEEKSQIEKIRNDVKKAIDSLEYNPDGKKKMDFHRPFALKVTLNPPQFADIPE